MKLIEEVMNKTSELAVVRAWARLHLGLVKLSGGSRYAAAGLSVRWPFCRVKVKRITRQIPRITGTPQTNGVIKAICAHFDVPARYEATVVDPLPLHSGFGSGTRHALAIARGVVNLAKIRVSTIRLARILGRGSRSMMGTLLFGKGGFAADNGDKIASVSFPAHWRVAIIEPAPDHRPAFVAHGEIERDIFDDIAPCSGKAAIKVVDSVSDMIMAVEQGDFTLFEKSVRQLQKSASRQFSKHQRGPASSPSGVAVLKYLHRMGVLACGQSSWGPTIFAIVPSESDAKTLAEKIGAHASSGSVTITTVARSGSRLDSFGPPC